MKNRLVGLIVLVLTFIFATITVAARYTNLPVTNLFVKQIENLGATDATVNMIGPFTWQDGIVDVDLAATNTYTIDKDVGSIFWIDDHESVDGTRDSGSGVSILLPKITSAYDNYECWILKRPVPFSGTTDICISTVPWVSGTTDHIWNVTSGITYENASDVMPEVIEIDAVGDWLKFKAEYAATGSTWYQIGRYIQ
ncbi:MAG: hypothetical protein SWO11_16960 [Thermodesulfobacteriota bacterium]|nr:hypothetical protein [Thermodesulfobacteriota bacterium]